MTFLSFILVAVSIFILCYLIYLSEKKSLFNVVFAIFFILFFFIAPLVQLNNDSDILVNYLYADNDLLAITNIHVSIFILVYVFSYYFLFRKHQGFSFPSISEARYDLPNNIQPEFISPTEIAAFIGFFIFLVYFRYSYEFESLAFQLIFNKVLFLLPLVMVINFLFLRKSLGWFILIFVFILALLALKNFLFEKRNAIGAVYLTLVYFIFYLRFTNGKIRSFLIFNLIVMIFIFPMSSYLTHDYGVIKTGVFDANIMLDSIANHFLELHYDAWANHVAMLTMLDEVPVAYGHQLIGTLGFFIPREFWEAKPYGSGELLGLYLISTTKLLLTNISFSVVSEAFINFGYFGLLLFPIILSKLVGYLEAAAGKSIYSLIFYIYFCFSGYFLLRGALLSAFAYLVGAYIAIVFLPKLYARTKNWSVKLSRRCR